MNKMKYILTLVLSASLFGAMAQDFNLYQLKTMPQNLQVNPAFMPASKYHIGGGMPLPMPFLPPVNIDVANSFAFKDIIQGTDSGTFLDMSEYIENMPAQGMLRFNGQFDIINFGFKVKDKHYFHMNYQVRAQMLGLYSKEFLNFFWKGNGHEDFIGQETTVGGVGMDATVYSALKLGYVHQYDDKWTFGVTPSLYFGHVYLSSKNTTFDFYTSESVDQLSITPNVSFLAGGLGASLLEGDSTDFGVEANPMGGFGVGIDLGATYKFNDKIDLSASIIDFGFINWKGYTLKNGSKTISFEGVDPADLIGGDSEETSIDEETQEGGGFMDSLMNDIESNITLTSADTTFSTGVPTKIFIGGTYKIDDKFTAGILTRQYIVNKVYKFGVSLSGSVAINNWLSSSLTYSVYNKSFNNVGAGVAVNMGPIQYYVMADNVWGLTRLDYTKNFNIRMGFNIRPTHERHRKGKVNKTPKVKAPKMKGENEKIKTKEEKEKKSDDGKKKVVGEDEKTK